VKTRRSPILFGVLAAGLLLTQQACSPASDSLASASSSDSVKLSNSVSGHHSGRSEILTGKRQIVIKPSQTTESIVAYDVKGRLTLIDGEAEHGLFVLVPAGDKFLIKTAKSSTGGEPDCAGTRNNGSAPLTVVATVCDASRRGQLFTITEQGADDEGDPTYAISVNDAFLQMGESGLIAEELGDAPLETTFSFVDNGEATLPILD